MYEAQPKKKKPWYLDNGCTRHMTSDKSLFQELMEIKVEMLFFVTTPKE